MATVSTATSPPQVLPSAIRIPTEKTLSNRLLRKGVSPTPKILHALRKKETLKSLRRAKKEQLKQLPQPSRVTGTELAGRPWEVAGVSDLSGLSSVKEDDGGKGLEELRVMMRERISGKFGWLLDEDVEVERSVEVEERWARKEGAYQRAALGDDERIRLLAKRLGGTELDWCDWRFNSIMKQSDILFNEINMLKLLLGLGVSGCWREALSVVKWVYYQKMYKHRKSRFVYTKLLSILGKARRPAEALGIFNLMLEDAQIYPDMAAYHSIAVTLGQNGLVKELTDIIDCMRRKPLKAIRNMRRKDWDPRLEPDVIIYNAVINGCIPSRQWKGVFWVMRQIRHNGLKPTAATYGLGMEVMLNAGKYDLVHLFFNKMRKQGFPPNALTYKVLVSTLWREEEVDKAVEVVRDMEQRGVVGSASVYYELACCLCNNGRWQDALVEIEKLKITQDTKGLVAAYTGMILSSLDGGHVDDCISIFEYMKGDCRPNTGTINAMLKVYARSDMFHNAKELFESTVGASSSQLETEISELSRVEPDAFTYGAMLDVAASALQWEYFEYMYRQMILSGFEFNQQKHSKLLIKASMAGKWYLLGHAFDTTLERGEIPHYSMFIEMICQTIIQKDFGRTVNLLNGMAYASVQVSATQWMNFFRRNLHRLGDEMLQDIRNYLDTCSLVSEDPVPGFVTSLQSILETRSSECAPSCINTGHLPPNVPPVPQKYLEPACGDSTSLDMVYTKTKIAIEIDDTGEISESTGEEDGYPRSSISENSVTDKVLDSLGINEHTLFANSPTASEILEEWKQDRLKSSKFYQ